jgi:hypothetical protein
MYSESLHTLTIVSRTISPLIPIISFCIFEDVYFILELGTVLSRWDCSWTNDANLPWNYLCLLYGPDLQYFDDRKESIHRLPPSQCVCFWQYPFCADRDGNIEIMDSVFDVLDLISKQWDDVSVLRVVLYSYECLTNRLRGYIQRFFSTSLLPNKTEEEQ